MRSFVYDSRVIENERQVKLERQARFVGNLVRTVVKMLVAFFFFVVLNMLINAIAQYTNLFSLSTWNFIEEAIRVLVVDNVITTSSVVYQSLLCIVSGLVLAGVGELAMLVLIGQQDTNSSERQEKQHTRGKREDNQQSTSNYGIVSYKNKVCILS